jgi:hypothetical protein
LNTYDRGDLIRIRGSFLNRALTDAEQAAFDLDGTLPVGAGVDPTNVSFFTKRPDGTETEYVYGTDIEVVRHTGGSYYVDVDADTDGLWWWRWESTGTGQSADEAPFYVRSEFDS